MPKQKRYVALDFGLDRGEAVAGAFDGKTMRVETLHEFPVDATTMLGTCYWDFPGMIINAKRGLAKYAAKYGATLSGVGCSSWGVDFGLLDKNGHLLANPVHFVDSRTEGAMEKLHAIIPERSLYQKTGAKARREATLYQLFSMAMANSPLLDKAVTMLLMADLVSYFLTGTPVQEYTLATTTGMYDAESRDWSRDVILSAKIPPVMVPEIIAPGTLVGQMLDDVAGECGLGMVPVIAPASHAMAGAVAAIPAVGDDWAYVVSDRWMHVGVEASSPILNDDSFSAGFTNQGGVDGSIRLAKIIRGVTLLDGCREAWAREDGAESGLDHLLAMAESAKPLARLFNPNDPRFSGMEPVPAVINELLAESGQPAAESRADFVRAVVDSLALAQSHAVSQLMEVTGKKYKVVHLVGWGAGQRMLCQLTADAIGLPVKAGPVAAKALGNALMQAIALGDIGSLAEAREIIANSFDIPVYEPAGGGEWDEAYNRFVKMV